MNKEIAGGVSPLKKRGGKAAKRATRKATGKGMGKSGIGGGYSGRGGYSKSGGGKNPGGYNVHTRFKPRAKPEGPKGGGGDTKETLAKPYSFDKDGNIVINNYNIQNTKGGTKNENININKNENINTNTSNVEKENKEILKSGEEYRTTEATTTSKRKSKGSFLEVWDENENNFQDKWKTQGGFDAWKIKAQKEIDEGYYSETRTVDGKKQKRTWTQKNDESKVYTPWVDA
jgi:hypothetical protein